MFNTGLLLASVGVVIMMVDHAFSRPVNSVNEHDTLFVGAKAANPDKVAYLERRGWGLVQHAGGGRMGFLHQAGWRDPLYLRDPFHSLEEAFKIQRHRDKALFLEDEYDDEGRWRKWRDLFLVEEIAKPDAEARGLSDDEKRAPVAEHQ